MDNMTKFPGRVGLWYPLEVELLTWLPPLADPQGDVTITQHTLTKLPLVTGMEDEAGDWSSTENQGLRGERTGQWVPEPGFVFWVTVHLPGGRVCRQASHRVDTGCQWYPWVGGRPQEGSSQRQL